MATSLTDTEFGEIHISRTARGRYIRISVAPNGRLRASAPKLATVGSIKRMVARSRDDIRRMVQEAAPDITYQDGDRIGKSHSLIVQTGATLQIKRSKLQLIATLPNDLSIEEPAVQRLIRDEVKKALKKEASHYLPRRLAVLADTMDCSYSKVRFSHASTRWGSCSSNGTISLNIALMKLPFELIDYVLIHELSHTHHMNHSDTFWRMVGEFDEDYLTHKRELKKHTPTI